MTAKWLGVAPWELADQSPEWLAAASTVMNAEAGAANERARADARRRKLAGMQRGA